MRSVDITLIFKKIDETLNLGYNQLYVNVDDLEDGSGFLRILGMQGSEYIIVYEDTFQLNICYQILEMLDESEYDIKDFTIK